MLTTNFSSYALQPRARHWIPAISAKILTTVTTGVYAFAYPMDPTQVISSWSARFPTLYEEYRVIAVKATVRPFSVTNPGVALLYWDEKTPFTTPSALSSRQRFAKQIALASANRPAVMTWRARDLVDLQYTPCATGVTPVALCIYTDTANYGAPIVATDVGVIEFEFLIEFRGFETNNN